MYNLKSHFLFLRVSAKKHLNHFLWIKLLAWGNRRHNQGIRICGYNEETVWIIFKIYIEANRCFPPFSNQKSEKLEAWCTFTYTTSLRPSMAPGPSPGCSSRGAKNQKEGPKTRRGATFLKYSIGCMQQPVGQTWNGGHPFKMGVGGTTGPPAGDGPAWHSSL